MITIRQEPDGMWSVYQNDYRVVTYNSKQAAEDLARVMRLQEADR